MPSGTVVSGLGTQLKRGDGGGPETFTTIPKVRNLKGPSFETTMLDTTALDTAGGFETFIPGLKSPGSITFELDFMPDDTTHQKILGDWVNNTLRNFQILWPDGVTLWAFSAYVKKPTSPDAQPNAVLTGQVELQISGAPTLVTA